MRLVYALEKHEGQYSRSIFLAGPSPRDSTTYNWRKQARVILHHIGFDGVVFIPLPRDGIYDEGYDHVAQIDWELEHLEKSGVQAFWIPRDLVTLPGFTTNVEFGRFSRSRAVLGYPEGASKMRYLQRIAEIDGVPVFDTLQETLRAAIDMLPV